MEHNTHHNLFICTITFDLVFLNHKVGQSPGRIMLYLHNVTVSAPTFFLSGIPGLEKYNIWIALPLCCIYIITLVANSTVLFIITREQSLHHPMYFFLSILLVTGLVKSNASMPKILCLLLFNSRDISFEGCLIQMFFVNAFSAMGSAVLLAMAFDRYTAICNPLRYTAILNNSLIAKIALMVISKGILLTFPLPFLFLRLPFCRSTVIDNTYCEQMKVAKLACADITVNNVYGFIVTIFVVGFIIMILLSYVMIARAIFKLPSKESRRKAFSTCTAHICIILIAYIPSLITVITNRFTTIISPQFQIILSNMYLVLPSMLNPIVYGIKTKQIKEKILQIFQSARLISKKLRSPYC